MSTAWVVRYQSQEAETESHRFDSREEAEAWARRNLDLDRPWRAVEISAGTAGSPEPGQGSS